MDDLKIALTAALQDLQKKIAENGTYCFFPFGFLA